jgi:predicted Zn finger-like uncharacterized protein
MDVTCDRCKADYEFDEALLGERGTTVKCSACGHVFRVLPPDREAVRSQLQLRYASDGSLRPLSSLRDLQQRVRAGEVSLDDELGREGFPFRPLRDVPELKNFFLAQPSRNNTPSDRSALLPSETSAVAPSPLRREPADPAREGSTRAARMPVAPESVAPGAAEHIEELSDAGLESDLADDDDTSTVPPPLPGTPERVAADEARARRAAEARSHSERVVEEQRAVNKTLPAPAGVPPEARPRSFGRGTMSGVGPDELQLPPPPRMPQVVAKSVATPAAAKPVAPANTPSGGSANPHASKLPPPGSGTVAGLPALKPHQTLHGEPLTGAPKSGMPPGSTHPLANRASARSGAPPTAAAAPFPGEPTRSRVPPVGEVELPKPPPEPDRFPQFKAVPAPRPSVPAAAGPTLYLDSKEPPPPRATQSSHGWLYAALLLLAAGAGGWWFGVTRLPVLGKAVQDSKPEPQLTPGSTRVAADPVVDTGLPAAAPPPAAPFAPPIPDISEELARRSGQPTAEPQEVPVDTPSEPAKPAAMANPEPAKPAAMANPEPAKPAAMANPEPAKPVAMANPEPVTPQPAKPQPAKPQPAKPQPAKPQPAKPQPAKPQASTAPAAAQLAPPRAAEPKLAAKLARAERAVAANPADYGAQLNRADALFARGDNAAAQDAYRQALKLRPTGSEANAGLGFALLQSGQASEALPYFDRAASSGYAEANIGLGDAYRSLGQPSSAKEAYQAYLERLPGGARSEYAHNALDKLSGRSPAPKAAEPAPAPAPAPEAYRPAGELSNP